MRLVSFQIRIIRSSRSSKNLREISSFQDIILRFIEIIRLTCSQIFCHQRKLFRERENKISKQETHGRARHNRAYALAFYDVLAPLTIWRLTVRRIESYRHSAHFVILFEISNIFTEFSTDKASRTRRRFTTQESCAGRLRISRDTAKHPYCVNVRQTTSKDESMKRKE